MSRDQDLEAPTIFVEAPPEDEQDDVLDGVYLNSAFNHEHPEMQALFRQVFPDTTSSSRNVPAGPGLISEQSVFSSFEQSALIGQQVSPLVTSGLRSAGNVFLAPNDQTSPVDASWSPVSTSEGDVFSDNWSESSSNWSPSVHSSLLLLPLFLLSTPHLTISYCRMIMCKVLRCTDKGAIHTLAGQIPRMISGRGRVQLLLRTWHL
ncbi:hypothetical protein BT96DRAFT_716708 [Gymnopus androsaceus JB14]|uniref:Uncharacterized protein n=1 Tax=Gymnopus androsaceus JB14 TaxID=1447944 RepID=A0A6A4HLA1_9AGAR|nr:hypothetical protein BT96DRAFT_716708 [Gymnopus androsaceus JB14]